MNRFMRQVLRLRYFCFCGEVAFFSGESRRCRSLSVMPSLEKATPEVSPKSLSMREARTGTILSVARATLPAQMVLRLRRVAGDLGDLAQDPSAPAPDRISAAKAMVTVQDQLIDLLGIPRRPAAAGKGKASAPMLDVSPTPPDLD
jgi:hypothetical protein